MDIKKLVDDMEGVSDLVELEKEMRAVTRRFYALQEKISGSLVVLTARDAEIDKDAKITDKEGAKSVYKTRKEALQAMATNWNIIK